MRPSFISRINKRAHSRQIVAILITAVVIVLLLLSGPATAFDLLLSGISDANPLQGDTITFTATMEIVANELVPISNLSINFSDGTNCYFDIDGDILTGPECAGITITPDDDTVGSADGNLSFNFSGTHYDYGYGYAATSPGILTYNISLDTGVFDPGSLNFSLNAIMTNGQIFTSDSESINIILDITAPQIIFNWWNTLDWNETTQSGTPFKLPNPKNFTTNNDIFYSPAERTIFFAVNATDDESGVASVTANLSEGDNPIGEFPSAGTCSGPLALVYNGATGLWEGNCTLAMFDSDIISDYLFGIDGEEGQVANFNVGFIAEDNEGNSDEFMYNKSTNGPAMPCTSEDENNCMPAFAIVNLEDFGVMEMNQTCVRFGSGTTNLSQELDFSDINFIIEIEVNMTCQEPGAPPGLNVFNRMVSFDFASLDFSSPAVGVKLGMLPEALQFEITPPLSWGDSRIYVNSTFFAELNTTTNITLSHLPFTSAPEIIDDPGAAGVNSSVWVTNGFEDDFGIITGNLTLKVNGFSGYNVTDNVTPIVTINYPADGSSLTGAVIINVTANGTGSEVSKVRILVDAIESTWSTELNDFNCTPASNGSEKVNCIYPTSLSSGNHNITVTAWDYGGTEPGNNATDNALIAVDITYPSVILNSPANDTLLNNGTVRLNFTPSDNLATNLTCVVVVDTNASAPFTAANGSWRNYTVTLSNGIYTWYANCSDNAGNSNATATRTFTVDTVAPVVSLISPNNSINWTSSTTPTHYFNTTDSRSGILNCVFRWGGIISGEQIDITAENGTANVSAGYLYGVPNGNLTWNISCTDAAGNTNTSVSRWYRVNDTTAPVISDASPSGEQDTSTTSVTLSVDTDESADCKYDTADLAYVNMTNNMNVTDDYGLNHEATYSGLSAGNSYTIYVSCIDTNGTASNTTTISFSVAAAAATHTTGGGGGVVTNPSTSQTWDKLTPGAAYIFKITSDDFGIKMIIIQVNNQAQSVRILMEKLTGLPASMTQLVSSKVYRYLIITATNLGDSNINGTVKIKFQVSQSWLLTNGIDPSKMVLMRYVNGAWVNLKTTLLSTDTKFAYYESETPGFSYFAIGTRTETGGLTAFAIIDMIRAFFQGKSTLTQFEIIDSIRGFYTKA